MFALHIFTVRGSEASAASGRYSELSEWQRSIKSRISVSPKILTGTATGERADCRRWREEGGERVAAVDRWQGALSPKPDVGHRNRKSIVLPSADVQRTSTGSIEKSKYMKELHTLCGALCVCVTCFRS